MARLTVLLALLPGFAFADDAVLSPADPGKTAAFDILQAQVQADGDQVTFRMTTAADAGSSLPEAHGTLAGAPVFSYVWPTTVDPASVGFEGNTGILALAATSHPDFDDTPLYDEDGDGDPANDGAEWHSHWVVLVPNDACGPDALSVRDIPDGEMPKLPATWPGLSLFIDSPPETPVLDGPTVTITMSLPGASGAGYDGVTAALRVNADLHAPLLCVSDVFDVASGNLSLPGKIAE